MQEQNNENQSPQVIENEADSESMILTKVNEDGTTSSYFDKRKLKIAPRSTLQFKVGPPFQLSNKFGNVVDKKTGQSVNLKIIPRIDRGFDNIDDAWVGYKRNYFTLVTSFQIRNYSLENFLDSSYQVAFLENFYRQTADIKYFAVKIKARTDNEHTEINLVQHTAKRDKGPQFVPELCPLIPSPLPKHQIIREASNVRNTNKMKKYDSTFFFHRDQEENKYDTDGILHSYPDNCIQKVARYERVQFASSINVKKPSQQNKHFRLYVVLGAVIETKNLEGSFKTNHCDEISFDNGEKGLFVYLQEMNTPPLIIRGRSPSNYTSSQRVTLRTNSLTPSVTEPIISGIQNTEQIDNVKNMNVNELAIIKQPVKKQKVGRPAKRKSKVLEFPKVDATTEYISLSLDTEGSANKKDEGYCISRNTKRIQTIDEIEKIMSSQLSLHDKLVSLKDSQGDLPSFPPREHKVFRDRPASLRNLSVDLKDIELKPFHCLPKDEMCTIGSLALNLPTDGTFCIGSSSHKREYDLLDSSANDDDLSQFPDTYEDWKRCGVKSKGGLSSGEISYIYNVTKCNYKFDRDGSFDNTEISNISRTIPRSMGVTSICSLSSSSKRRSIFPISSRASVDMIHVELSDTSMKFDETSFA
ncbi:similar to Saccharomyces cerevisiae YHR124W NDT80 Meiosis-specific transcription factor required for exit from pachytene and for full meiotic recombination [Maudiozyma barnettii]|uniref:Similar to Saccharomyces cerevisiae YHR124W NDT80 Meiosis-specific transcription factor required for exit from pachytene and for full meiotic recombination n=1 Tax=Maudiozyma barnettii TaxID=61262 RepID=A0A8H2VFI1_9SACH|nr:transcription factor NDT80 [Kazachstania barnettii]CAB4254204.1 similar to Saccharomyces cerevisiae YHR124W NDT80 Meiosis-specific transcription factor required for exit from pachytene and for full meiotic recombination [Kazachstania barnettii]CAD1781938.1 similar to Saccharomyces cerevisiae YHR124W NDT80 Meiosis-specific transcription factor required for exit from pachytene and for full meiotic recombination [Kazachstania barnettii]